MLIAGAAGREIGVPDQVGALSAGAGESAVAAGDDIDGAAGLGGEDAVGLPTTEDPFGAAVLGAGDVPEKAGDEALADIEIGEALVGAEVAGVLAVEAVDFEGTQINRSTIGIAG